MQTESTTILQPLPKPEAKGSCAPSTCSAPSPEVVAALTLCHRLRDGAARMTKQQFRNCLNRSIGATKDYADNVRVAFQDNPAAFLAHRNPQSQSHELLRVLLEITKEQNDKLRHGGEKP